MELLFLLLLIPGVLFVLPIAAWVSARRTRARIEELEAALERHQSSLDRLSEVVGQMRREARAAAPPAGVTPEQKPAQPAVPVSPKITAPPAEHVAHPAAKRPVMPAPPAQPGTVPPSPAVPPAPVAPPPIVQRPWPELDQPRAAAAERPPAAERPAAVERPAARRQEPPPPPRPPRPVQPPEPPQRPFDWESLVGVKLFSAVAGIALVFAAVFFLRYSVQQGWLQPPIRVLIGTLVGITLLVLCELKAARRYPVTANAIDAAAIAILFSTFFAAHALWKLIPVGVTFGLLAMVTGLAVLLSIRRESLFIAVLGLLGGFATPALLSTGENRPIPLFAYLLLLNVGLAWVAYRNTWPILSVLTLVLTTAYQWVWVFRFMAQADISLAMAIFLVFPLVTFAGLLIAQWAQRAVLEDDDSREGVAFERTAMAAAVLPLLFAAYLAAVPAYGARPDLLFGFLALIDAGLLAIALARGRMALHATGALATVLVTAIWLAASYSPGARYLVLAYTSGFVILYLAAPVVAGWFSRALTGAGAASVYAAPILLFVFPALAALEPAFAAPAPLFGPLLVLLLLCAWRAVSTGGAFLYFTAVFFAVAAQAVWSAEYLTVARLGTAVSLYAIFGVVTAAVPVVARRVGRALEPAGAGGVMLLASLGLLFFLSLGDVAPAAIWALALLLAILNAGVFIESASARLPLVAQAGSLLSWVILGTWWMRAAGTVGLLPSLAVLTGLTLVTLAGHAWAHRVVGTDADQADRAGFASGLYLGLVGHMFLFFVALNREWSVPPWPLFATLAAMTLATSATALVTRAAVLHAAGAIAAAIVVAVWTETAGLWPVVGLAGSAVVTAFALAWMAIGRRAGATNLPALAAVVVLFVAEMTAIVAARQAPPFALIPLAHVVNVALILTLAWRERWRGVALGSTAIVALALLEWGSSHQPADWQQLLVLAGALYAVFTAYPLVVGAKSPGDREPWLVALAGAAMTFFAARAAFINGGLEWMIGVVPVAQGLVTAILLRALLRVERAGARDLGRLALVAGAALAFVTVAIPMQLEHQWITIGWALEGAALAWIYLRIPHRGLLLACAALLATVFARLALNPAVFVYEPRGATRIFNWYLYTYLIAATAMFVAAWWLSRVDDRVSGSLPRLSHVLPAAGGILLFLLLNIEIADFYATGPEITFRFGVTLSQDLTYTIGWLTFGLLLLAVGIYTHARPARVTAVVMIAVTTFKCFLYDLGSLEGLYRVASLVGLAMSLALVSLALQKYVLAKPRETA